jgi:hypothetical protein
MGTMSLAGAHQMSGLFATEPASAFRDSLIWRLSSCMIFLQQLDRGFNRHYKDLIFYSYSSVILDARLEPILNDNNKKPS